MFGMYKLVLSEIFACRLDSETYGFLSAYPRMVDWWLSRGRDATQEFRDFSAFRSKFYNEWKEAWRGYNSQHAQTSCSFAFKALNSKVQSKDELKQSFAFVSPVLAKVEDKTLIFTTSQTKKARVELVPKTSAQCVLLEQTQNLYWQVGQVFLTPKWCAVPFARSLDLTKENDSTLQEFLKYTL
jgi:hypothetical protein